MSVEMRAVKPLKYRTRHLVPGENFRVKNEREARVLAHMRKAELVANPNREIALDDAREAVGLPPLSPATDDIKALRDQYEEVLGKRPFPGWSIEQLKEKMAKLDTPTVGKVQTAEVIEDSEPVLVPVSESPVTVEVVEEQTQRKPRGLTKK